MHYPSPCNSCKRTCGNGSCPRFRAYINAWWKYFNICYRRICNPQMRERTKFIYEHPDIYRQYLAQGPCKNCNVCEDCETPCAAYWMWWDARMAWFRRRLRK